MFVLASWEIIIQSFYFFFIVTDLKKHFLENPYSVRVKLGVQVQLRCVPPEGVPPPEISWLKDGEPLKFAPDQDHVLIQSSEGHLIFPQVRVQDVGNYSCVAQNVAARRISDPAQLLIQGI
jgi:leucine-rich repeat transmembrane protein FLRT